MPSSSSHRVVVIGAGIAGLATACALRQRGVSQVRVLETEAFPFAHASGKNAAIYRPLEADPVLCRLAARSKQLLGRLRNDQSVPLLDQRGLLLLGGSQAGLEKARDNAHREGLHAEVLVSGRQIARATGLELRDPGHALWSLDGGVLDPHEIGQTLRRLLSAQNVRIECQETVSDFLLDTEGRCRGVLLNSGRRIESDDVVVAAGAMSGRLAVQAGSTLPLLPMQRHLGVLCDESQVLPPHSPVVWSLRPEFYFRPEAGGVLVSPCDESPSSTSTPHADIEAFSSLFGRFDELYPALREAPMRRFWACIRTKAVDGRPVIGPDPSVLGLHYVAGLGGFGMSCGLAAAELFAEQFVGKKQLDMAVAPLRFHLPWQRAGAEAAQ